MILLFSNDDSVRQLQRAAARVPNGVTVAPEDLRREAIENARELREHARWRQFAFLLFVAPTIVGLVLTLLSWIAVRSLVTRALPALPF